MSLRGIRFALSKERISKDLKESMIVMAHQSTKRQKCVLVQAAITK